MHAVLNNNNNLTWWDALLWHQRQQNWSDQTRRTLQSSCHVSSSPDSKWRREYTGTSRPTQGTNWDQYFNQALSHKDVLFIGVYMLQSCCATLSKGVPCLQNETPVCLPLIRFHGWRKQSCAPTGAWNYWSCRFVSAAKNRVGWFESKLQKPLYHCV